MFLIFVDECGYQPNWAEEKALNDQPVHVVSAVATAAGDLVYAGIREGISQLKLPGIDHNALGRGQEIKAKDIDKGHGFWSQHNELRDKVRRLYLDQQSVTYIIVCINKRKHLLKYANPVDPAILGLQYLLERVQGFLTESNAHGLVIVDAYKRAECRNKEFIADLIREGSWGIGVSKFYGIDYEWHLKIENILEIHFGDSKHSLGLQVADFVARHTYSWWKSGKEQTYPGWNYIEQRLWKHPNYMGWGYKEFP